jgi:uncharacterized protein YjbJ (UPF0337 family)
LQLNELWALPGVIGTSDLSSSAGRPGRQVILAERLRRGWRRVPTLLASREVSARSRQGNPAPRDAPGLAQMERWLVMSLQDKIANKAQVLKGKVKETAGKITRDPELEGEGKLEQGKGHIKQAGEKVKDAGKSVFDS